MPQQSTLVARPVILSENKQNAIPHGRPLSPIGTVRSARPFFVPRPAKGSFTEEKLGDTISIINKPPQTDTPATGLMDYHKLANDNLITINNNLSLMLKESFAGIDSICQKVRLCLLDANTVKPPDNLQILASEYLETRNVENLDSSKSEIRKIENQSISESIETRAAPYRRDSFLLLSTCDEEEVETSASIDEVPELPDDMNEITAEIVEEINDEVDYEKEYPDHVPEKKRRKSKKSPSLTPFFTILNPTNQSAESVGVNILQSLSSRIGLSRKCTTDSFQETMLEVEKLDNYEHFLTSMVEGINRDIEQCYSEFPRIEGMMKSGNDKNVSNNTKKNDDKKDNRPASTRSHKRKGKFAISDKLKSYHDINLMEDQFSENDLTCYKHLGKRRLGLSVYSAKMDFTHPDVYRKRAITDLHRRLEAQIEANDSLIFFQKLMAKSVKHMSNDRPSTVTGKRNDIPAESYNFKSPMQYIVHPKHNHESRKQRSLSDLSRKYQDSLWFKQKRTSETKRGKREPTPLKKRRDKKSKKDKQLLPQSYTIESSSVSEGKTSVINKASFKSPSQASVCNCKIKVTNNQPMSEAQKCKLHWMRAKYSQLRQKKLKYLDILDDITKNDLLPIKAEYPRRDQITSTGLVKESYLYKLLYGKNKDTQNAWDQLFRPTSKCGKDICKKCSMTDIANKEDLNEKSIEPNLIAEGNIEQNPIKEDVAVIGMVSTCDLDKGDVIRKLSKYIFAEEDQQITPKRIFTVMPVHVFYDNARIPSDTRKHAEMPPQKLPLLPMKETKEFIKKAEWNEAAAKKSKATKVVYDPILRRIEKEIRMAAARPEIKSGTSKMGQTNSWSPRNFAQYCSPPRQSPESRVFNIKLNPVDKSQQKQKNAATNRTPIAEIFKRSPKPSTEQVHPYVPPLWNSPYSEVLDKYQKDTEVRQKIQKTISAEATSRMKSDQQRKIWENKYGKSVGQKLLNFIEKQPDQYQMPVPKYAMPSKKIATHPGKHQMMLEQLRNLKQKNDSIQTNIQKAIIVIENKMVDILSKPTTSESIEAFDAMEKEITNVLSLMKSPSQQKAIIKKEKPGEACDYGGDISDELFQRLDRILESPSSALSSKNSARKEEKPKRKIKLEYSGPPKSTDMNQVCFSSTSATGEEKFTVTAISPKRSFKSPTRAPYIRNAIDKVAPEDISKISNELRKLENELKLNDSVNDLDQANADMETLEVELTNDQTPTKRASILKHRRSVPGQDQVVNIALVSQTNPEGSAGDQLLELKKLLENELKSVDVSDDRTHSIAVSFSQGDYGGQNGHKSGDMMNRDQSKEIVSQNTELDVDSGLEEKDETSVADHNSSTIDSVLKVPDMRPIHVVIKKKLTDMVIPERPKSPLSYQLKGSQLSLDTGPYFTPLTSPLTKTRCQIDGVDEKQHCKIVEEEKQSSVSLNEECDLFKGNNGLFDGAGDDNQKENQETSLQSNDEEKPQNQNKDEDSSEQSYRKKETEIEVFLGNEDSKSEKTEKDSFYENVNRIITRVENVYNQLEEFEVEMLQEETDSLAKRAPTYQEHVHEPLPPETPDPDTDMYLAPFMHAVKDLRKSVHGDKSPSSSRKSSPRMNRSSSLYNVLSFLDNLSDIKEERPVEVYTPRICFFAYIVHIPQIFYQFFIQDQTSFTLSPVPEEATQSTTSEDIAIAPPASVPSLDKPLSPSASPLSQPLKKKSGCLKTSSTSHSNVNAVTSKSKQKVSFLLLKEEKSTQVTSCPFHSAARILSQQKFSISTSTGSTDNLSSTSKRDEQVSAYLDACENKSVDKMSLPDDETTYQSTFEFSDEISLAKSLKMPEQIVQNLQETLEKEERNQADVKKNVVEIFRNSYAEENATPGIRVFTRENDIGDIKTIPETTDREVKCEEVVEVSKEQNGPPAVKVFYDNYQAGKEYIDLKLLAGIYNEESILQVEKSLSRNLASKKQGSLEKLLNNLNEEILSTQILKEATLLEPLKNLNEFIDSNLLKEAVEKRRMIRMLRRKSSLTLVGKDGTDIQPIDKQAHGYGEKENFLKGFYVFVYLLMFTALNLEYKCVV